MITIDEFITCLQAAGWKDTGDAQHEAVKVFHECLSDAEAKAVRDAQPRTWSAGEIGSAPEGEYRLYYPDIGKWGQEFSKQHLYLFKGWSAAFGPIPQPPVAAVTDGSAG